MFVYVYYLSTSQQPRHNEQVYSFTQRWRHCTSSLIYTVMVLLYKFTHLHRDGATVQIHSFIQRWCSCTSLLIYTEMAPLYKFTHFTEMALLYKFTHLHRDGAAVQVYSFHRDGASVQVYSFTQRGRPCTSFLICTEMAPLYKPSPL